MQKVYGSYTQKIFGSVVWFIATLFVIYSFCLNTASAVFSDAIKSSLHANDFNVSLAMGAFVLGFACMQIPVGYLLDKFNARFIVSAGVFLLAIGNVAVSFSTNLVIYTLSNFIQGLGASFAFISAAVLISQWFGEKLFPILFGLTQTLSCISAGIIHYYFTLALTTHTWIDLYRVLAVFGFSLLVLTLIIVKSPSDDKREKNISLMESLSITLKNKQIWLCAIAAATSFGVLLAYAGFWYIRVQTYYSVEHLQSVIISGMIFAGIGVGTPLFGWVSNIIKSRKTLIHIALCLGTMFLLLGIYLPHFDIDTLIIIKIISFLIGFFLSGSMLFYTMVSEISTNKTRGVAISMLNTSVFLFYALMLFIPYAFVTNLSKDFFTYLWILPFFIVFSLLLLYFVKDTYRL
jgi:MFS family permease